MARLKKQAYPHHFRAYTVHHVRHYLGGLVLGVRSSRNRHKHLLYVVLKPAERAQEHSRHLAYGFDLRYFCPLDRRKHLRIGCPYFGGYRHF